ncbi:(2Fe-2S)-binding protein [Roseibium sp. HPY-6]|uniref:(2Fe-2S)-binding protein n=1 Tax=Roseibium sp. HPY-6 TaxID=3229852 RepID=UPI00338DECD2
MGAKHVELNLTVNGESVRRECDARTTLLDLLRDHLELTGTKKGCNHGQCGACTVLVDGKRVLSCLTLAGLSNGVEVTTIEGLGTETALHPVQDAFIRHDSFQCGYCTSGQIMSAIGMLAEPWASDDDEVREAMSGNICRCAAYPNIISAIQEVRKDMETEHA